jgi:hypothetical protein
MGSLENSYNVLFVTLNFPKSTPRHDCREGAELKTRSPGAHKGLRQIDAFSIFIAALMLFRKPWHVSPPQTFVSPHEGNAWVGGDVWFYGAVRICAGMKMSWAMR